MTKQMQEWPYGRSAIGFADLFTHLQYTAQMGSYPPYNLVEESDTVYRIEIAAAGFSKDDLTIVHEAKSLSIIGESIDVESEGTKYIHKGVSSKRFERSFTLDEQVKVTDAKMKDGMLVIRLEQVIPEELQPKTIKIS
jgi:molecular chaperone IbpA